MVRVSAKTASKSRSESQPPPPLETPKEAATPQQLLEGLEQAIRSKERTLALLEAKLPRASLDLTDQITLRDKRIEELTERVIKLESSSASHQDKHTQIAKLTSERDELNTEIQRLNDENRHLHSQIQSLTLQITTEKSTFKSQISEFHSEIETLNSQLLAKTDQTTKMKSDIVQLSKIVKDMSQLNGELNEKVQKMNKDMEGKNTELYAATAKSVHMEEMEQSLSQAKSELAASNTKMVKLLEEKSRLEVMENVSRVSQEALRDVESRVDGMNSQELVTALQQVRHELKKVTMAQRQAHEDPVLLKHEIKELKGKMTELTMENTRLSRLNSLQLDRIKALETDILHSRTLTEDDMQRLEKRAKTLLEGMEKARERSSQSEENAIRFEAEAIKAKNMLVGLQSQVQMLKEQLKIAKTAEENAVTSHEDIKNKLKKMKLAANAQELSIQSREAKLKQIASKMKLLSDELWRKDTELMKKEGEIRKMEEEIGKWKGELQQIQMEIKQKSAHESGILEEALSEKDKEISMLKDMLRSSSKQVQHKDVDLTRVKRRLEALTSAPLEPAVTTYIETMDVLLDVREKVRTGRGKGMAAMVRKRLGVEEVPGEKGDLVRFIEEKMEEAARLLEKSIKAGTKFSISEYSERVTSPELRQVLCEDQVNMTVSRLLAKCRSL